MYLLSKPDFGWTNFGLGKQEYSLSYLTEIPTDWLDQAIHGLETLSPFAVHGFCEPGRFLCLVSYWNCHIIYERDDNITLNPNDSQQDAVHISMLDFCKMLHSDISSNLDQWCDWNSHYGYSEDETSHMRKAMKEKLQSRLERLNTLILEKENAFNEDRFFC